MATSTSTFNNENVDYNDAKVWSLIRDGKTKGVFQLESQLGKSWAKRVRPNNIEELAALISLIRPGCLKAIIDGILRLLYFILTIFAGYKFSWRMSYIFKYFNSTL